MCSEQIEKITNKKEQYEKLLERKPDAVVVLGTIIKETRHGGLSFQSGSFADKDKNGEAIVGGRERVMAAAELSAYFPESKIVTASSPRNIENPAVRDLNMQSLASVMREELIILGVPKEKIILEEESLDTINGLKNSIALCSKYNWKNLVIVTSHYHVPRVQAMINKIEQFSYPKKDSPEFEKSLKLLKNGVLNVRIISAKEVLLIKDPRWSRYFEKVESLPEYQKRVRLENQGIENILKGNYKIT